MKVGKWIGKLIGMAKRNQLHSDERGLLTMASVLVLIAVGVVLTLTTVSLGAGFLLGSKTPVAQVAFEDYPGSIDNGNAFIIKNLGGDAIPLNATRLVIYDTAGHAVIYSKIIANDTSNFTLTNTGIFGTEGQALDPSESIIVHSAVINNKPGTYTIQLVYEPTKQTIAKDMITIGDGSDLSISTSTCTVKCGDVNCDGKVDISDVTALMYHIGYGQEICSECAADVNGDGSVNMGDVTALLYHVTCGTPIHCSCSCE